MLGAVEILASGYLSMMLAQALLCWLAWTGANAQPAVAVLGFVWSGSTWTQTPPQQDQLISAAPAEASLVVSLNASAIYLGIGAGPLLGGLLITTSPALVHAAATAVAATTALSLAIT